MIDYFTPAQVNLYAVMSEAGKKTTLPVAGWFDHDGTVTAVVHDNEGDLVKVCTYAERTGAKFLTICAYKDLASTTHREH